jgi:hypothetical protein
MKRKPGMMCTSVNERCRAKMSSSARAGAKLPENRAGSTRTSVLRTTTATPMNTRKMTTLQRIRGVLSLSSITCPEGLGGTNGRLKRPFDVQLEIRERRTRNYVG